MVTYRNLYKSAIVELRIGIERHYRNAAVFEINGPLNGGDGGLMLLAATISGGRTIIIVVVVNHGVQLRLGAAALDARVMRRRGRRICRLLSVEGCLRPWVTIRGWQRWRRLHVRGRRRRLVEVRRGVVQQRHRMSRTLLARTLSRHCRVHRPRALCIRGCVLMNFDEPNENCLNRGKNYFFNKKRTIRQ